MENYVHGTKLVQWTSVQEICPDEIDRCPPDGYLIRGQRTVPGWGPAIQSERALPVVPEVPVVPVGHWSWLRRSAH